MIFEVQTVKVFEDVDVKIIYQQTPMTEILRIMMIQFVSF